MLCYVMLCYVMLCYVMLCYVMLCYVMLFYFILFHSLLLSLHEFDGKILPGKSCKNYSIRFCSPILLDHGKD